MDLTPLQSALSEGFVYGVHIVLATVLLVFVGIVSITFGVRESKKQPAPGQHRSPKFWRNYHFFFAAVLFAALLSFAARKVTAQLPYHLWLSELVALYAFSMSWLAAGLNWPILFGKGKPPG
jgi:hypothetical protein